MRSASPVIFLSLILLACHAVFPDDNFGAPAALERVEELLKARKPQDALEALASLSPSREERSGYHYAFARALVQMNEPYKSIEHYRLAYVYAASEADKERFLIERAEIYTAMGYASEAVVNFEVFLRQYPKSNWAERAELGIAEARYRLGDFREAAAHFDKAGSSLRAMYGKANALQSLGRTKEAREIYVQLIENDPEVINSSQETLYNIGENYRQSGALGDAKVFFTSVKDDLIKYRAAIGLGLIALEEKRFEAAVKYFTSAAESPDRKVQREAVLNRADANMRMGNTDEAAAALREVRQRHPYGAQYDAASLLLVRLERERGNFDQAVSVLKSLVYRRVPLASALDELETVLSAALGRDRRSFVKHWNEAGRWLLDPARAATLTKFARGLMGTGKPFLELSAWLVRNGSDEARREARLLLAEYYVTLGDTSAAWGYINRARIRGHDDDVLRVKARAYLADKEPLKASKVIRTVRRPTDDDLVLLFDAARSLEKTDDVIRYASRAAAKRRLGPRAAVRFADILYDAGRKGEALACYRAAARSGDAGAAADIAWAGYRIAELGRGGAATPALQPAGAGKSAVDRFTAAELKAAGLRQRIEGVGL